MGRQQVMVRRSGLAGFGARVRVLCRRVGGACARRWAAREEGCGWQGWLLGALVCAVGLLFFWPLLYKLGMRSVCYGDWAGFCAAYAEAIPGGVLRWVASWCTVLWQWPWLGGGVLFGLMVGVSGAGRLAGLRGWQGWVMPGVVVWLVAYCGFSVWIFRDATFVASHLLFWGVVLGVAGVGRRWGLWGLLGLLLWPLVGFASVFGVALGCVPAFGGAARRGGWRAWGSVGVRLAGAVVVGCWGCWGGEADVSWLELAVGCLPWLFEAEAFYWNVGVTVGALLMVGLLLAGGLRCVRRWQGVCGGALAALGLLLAVWMGMDPLHPLVDLLTCERALARGEPAWVLQLPEERVVAHRMLGAYVIYGLWRTEALEERLFDYAWQVSHEASTIDEMELDGFRLLEGYGLVQLARRWCYESVVNKGWSAEKYALLARLAWMTGEPRLARRYIRQLARIPLRGDEAAHLQAVLEGREAPDQEWMRVVELHQRLSVDAGSPVFEGAKRLEEGIYNRYAVLRNGNKAMVGLYLCASLLRKDETPLVENFDVILQVWPERPLPRAFQEGLLVAESRLKPQQRLALRGALAPETLQRWQAFQAAAKRHEAVVASCKARQAWCVAKKDSRGARKVEQELQEAWRVFRERFGRSYWFYVRYVQ